MRVVLMFVALLCLSNHVFAESDAILCTQGDKEACDYAAIAYEDDAKYEMALTYFRKGCDLDSSYGCFWLGIYLDTDFPEYLVTKDVKTSIIVYKKACEMNHASACNNLGFYIREGKNGQTKDPQLAMTYFEKACLEIEEGEGEACLSLGSEYDEGENVKRDQALAVTIYRRGCDEINHAGSCYAIANAFYNGGGVSESDQQAKLYYAKACEGGYEDGCEMLDYLFN